MSRRSALRIAGGLSVGLGLGFIGPARSEASAVTVFAAASLADVLTAWSARRPGPPLRFAFAASSTLARQIEQGARADLFISADEDWMEYLQQRRLTLPASRRVVAGNRLVVVRGGASDAAAGGELPESTAAIRAALQREGGRERIAAGDPAHVPAGRYAQAALTRLGLWEEIAPRLARADSVRSALAFVERGEAAAGIVYATDARLSTEVRAVARFPTSSHAPIRYPAALVAGAGAGAAEVLAELFTPDARSRFAAAGFTAP